MPKKINLKLYDVDKCLYHGYSLAKENGKVSPIQQWLITNNESFLNKQVQQIQADNYEKVIIAYGTNRQAKVTDDANSLHTESCAPVLPVIQRYLNNRLIDCEVVLDPFLMADIYGEKQAGESYRAILKEKYGQSKDEKHSVWLFDYSKISLLYAHAHRISMLHPDVEKIVIDFYDDNPRILTGCETYFNFESNNEVLPKNVILNLHYYNGSTDAFYEEINGHGETDTHYDWSVRYMSARACSIEFTSAEELKNYHTSHYLGNEDYYKKQMYNPVQDASTFKHFRQTEISKLESNKEITHTGNYTTALSLHSDKLIPEEFIKDVSSKEDFLKNLSEYLRNPDITRENILDLFNQIKNPEGKYKFIHSQRNPRWDHVRLWFKSNCNANEKYFWHTATFQQAVKILKIAYLNNNKNAVTESRVRDEDNFIDYMRGNSFIHPSKTTTRKQFRKI